VKARRVKRLDPAAPLADNVERIVRVRLDELSSFAGEALEPEGMRALHDMRIAAKRLRYILELTAFCFGDYAATAAKRAKELQDLLGEIHDCDVQLPRVEAHARLVRSADATAVRELAGRAPDLAPDVTGRAPDRNAYAGLELLAVHLEARRALLFGRFQSLWRRLEREGFQERLAQAVAERPAETRMEAQP
jgi:hypothetical protein